MNTEDYETYYSATTLETTLILYAYELERTHQRAPTLPSERVTDSNESSIGHLTPIRLRPSTPQPSVPEDDSVLPQQDMEGQNGSRGEEDGFSLWEESTRRNSVSSNDGDGSGEQLHVREARRIYIDVARGRILTDRGHKVRLPSTTPGSIEGEWVRPNAGRDVGSSSSGPASSDYGTARSTDEHTQRSWGEPLMERSSPTTEGEPRDTTGDSPEPRIQGPGSPTSSSSWLSWYSADGTQRVHGIDTPRRYTSLIPSSSRYVSDPPIQPDPRERTQWAEEERRASARNIITIADLRTWADTPRESTTARISPVESTSSIGGTLDTITEEENPIPLSIPEPTGTQTPYYTAEEDPWGEQTDAEELLEQHPHADSPPWQHRVLFADTNEEDTVLWWFTGGQSRGGTTDISNPVEDELDQASLTDWPHCRCRICRRLWDLAQARYNEVGPHPELEPFLLPEPTFYVEPPFISQRELQWWVYDREDFDQIFEEY
ncbi:uncharacterized protein EV420DRAFT_1653602 [Desarmillaria tabescens]|uniref:Uncharacterized protein n=1 Tax=Armillaria tabescens TaxID=1929756 RepID=A0AA39J460_ARMTA|nr:uncharacterized protein EV420DRAFT_1653602 [Desarmillaria tabescens]KAK0434982.1 hypothetical protein EV420DRAFT_1653602 [Desarmillaria tabescens]